MAKAVLGEAGRRVQRQKDFQKTIRVQMTATDVTQESLGDAWGISQVGAGQRIKKLNISYEDLVQMFKLLEFSDEQILKVMKG